MQSIYYWFIQKNGWLLLGLWVLSSCASPKPSSFLGEWLPADEATASFVSKLRLNHQKGLYWYASEDSTRYRYAVEGDRLELMNRYGVYHYRVLRSSQRKMVWQSEENESLVFSFRKSAEYKGFASKQGRHKAYKPTEKDIYDLIYALTGPDVEMRLGNLLEEFADGDYVTTPTLYHLTGVSMSERVGEYPEEVEYRKLIARIRSIRRVGNDFELSLLENENIRASLPIHGNEEGDRRVKTTTLDLFISKNAKVMIMKTSKGVKIDIDGVRVGKGWLKIGLPTFRISGDYGYLLGFRFYLAR